MYHIFIIIFQIIFYHTAKPRLLLKSFQILFLLWEEENQIWKSLNKHDNNNNYAPEHN